MNLFRSKTYAPVQADVPGVRTGPRGAPFGGNSNSRPRIRTRALAYQTTAPDVENFLTERLSISEPTLVKVAGMTFGTGPTVRFYYQAFWRRYGNADASFDTTTLPYMAVPFLGPYAYLTAEGEYDLIFYVETSPLNEDVAITLQVATGFDPMIVDSLLDSGRAHDVTTGRFILAAAGENYVDPLVVPRHKSLMLMNRGTGTAQVRFGLDAFNALQLPVSDDPVYIGPDILGRTSLNIASAAGTTVAFVLGRW